VVKLLYAGPSLSGADIDLGDIILRPPAAHGDVTRAVLQGADAIGLVDGLFDAVAAVWHKEILFALSRGVRVLGGASMGALRAAECAPFGMEPVGRIALSYLEGGRDDDADVGLIHGPAELDYLPLTEPFVDIEATLDRLTGLGLLAAGERTGILSHARSIFFGERTLDQLIPPPLQHRRDAILSAYQAHRVQQKRRDALELVQRLRSLPDRRDFAPAFTLAESPMWRRRLAALAEEIGVTPA
jgi:hypothetical protein